jgi:hypothetical protein
MRLIPMFVNALSLNYETGYDNGQGYIWIDLVNAEIGSQDIPDDDDIVISITHMRRAAGI